jgi:hypothetical protein
MAYSFKALLIYEERLNGLVLKVGHRTGKEMSQYTTLHISHTHTHTHIHIHTHTHTERERDWKIDTCLMCIKLNHNFPVPEILTGYSWQKNQKSKLRLSVTSIFSLHLAN